MDLDVGQLRKQAKELVRAARAGDERGAGAPRRPRADPRAGPARAGARARARALGGPGGRGGGDRGRLRPRGDRSPPRPGGGAPGRPARRSRDDPWAALVLGDGWEGDPTRPAARTTGRRCSTSGTRASRRRARARAARRGADPNVTFSNEYGDVGALRRGRRRARPRADALLLESGADPDDNESLYHSCEADSPECLELLLEAGARTRGTNALAHALDRDEIEFTRALLELGEADPNEGAPSRTPSAAAEAPSSCDCWPSTAPTLDRPGGETWRGDVPLRTPYAHAVIRGRDDVAAALEELGADTDGRAR